VIHCFIVLKHNFYLISHKVILSYLEISVAFVLVKTQGLEGIMVSTQSLAVCSYAHGIKFFTISTDNTENTCKISVFSLVPYEWHS